MTPSDCTDNFKLSDGTLSDPEWCQSGDGAAIYGIAGELWRAVKEARNLSAGTQQPEPMYLISESIKKQMLRAVGKVQEALTWDCDEERALRMDAQIQIFYRLWDGARGPVPAERKIIAPNRSDFPCREEYDNAMAEWNRDTTIAAQARESVLDKLDELISPSVSDARKREIVESLRTGQERE